MARDADWRNRALVLPRASVDVSAHHRRTLIGQAESRRLPDAVSDPRSRDATPIRGLVIEQPQSKSEGVNE